MKPKTLRELVLLGEGASADELAWAVEHAKLGFNRNALKSLRRRLYRMCEAFGRDHEDYAEVRAQYGCVLAIEAWMDDEHNVLFKDLP